MDTRQIDCSSCKTRLKVPSSLAPGKKVKCPKCGQLVTMPAAVSSDADYEIVNDAPPAPAPTRVPAPPRPAAPSRVPAPPRPPTPSRVPAAAAVRASQPAAATSKSCPYCGEQILESAVKCRHCGEFVDEEKAASRPRSKAAKQSAADELTPAEYIVATLGAPVGLVIGIIWATRKQTKAKPMIQASALSCIIVAVLSVVYFTYFRGEPEAPAYAGPLTGLPFEFSQPQDQNPDPPLDFSGRSLPTITAPDMKVVESQPAGIQRAMRATVCILSGPGLGTGVVIRREGGTAIIITNRHVVDPFFAVSRGLVQSTSKPTPKVKFITNDEKDGKIVWEAPDQVDLALVEVACPDGVEAVAWNSVTDVQIGAKVFAVGNPAGLGWTTTFGQVSAFRDHDFGSRKVAVIQTDTRIGSGNSGGGLYTEAGDLIGINTFVVASSRDTAGETGLGFAIRKNLLAELKPEALKIPSGDAAP